LEVKWLEDFLALAGTLNFSKAADERNVTQSAFSRRIRQLEAWVGTSLIDRATYPSRLTDAGQRFVPGRGTDPAAALSGAAQPAARGGNRRADSHADGAAHPVLFLSSRTG
jgi:hypothetical protein